MNWDQLVQGVALPFHPDLKVPALTEVRLPVPLPAPVEDVERTATEAVVARLAGSVTPGMTVAVGGGSRGLTDRVPLLRGAIAGLRALGAEPFVVPAMGSHGGATADGQRAMLETLGMTEDALGAEIRATMETVEVARTAAGMPLYLDRHAAGADGIFPVNRIKPHTCFKGPIESGLTKMSVVGFGKQPGAAQIHACGPVEMRNRILDGIAALKATGRVLGGVGTIESAGGDVVKPSRIYGELGKRMERDAVVICDGGDFASYAGKFVEVYEPGCWLDTGPYGCLGNGPGYAIAARTVRPSSQIVLLLGDGAAGFSLMDVDTLVRHQLPVVLVVGNNGMWGLEKHPMQAIYGWDMACDLRPGTGYDEVCIALGGGGETVRTPDQIGPALDRAFASGLPYVVNVLTDPADVYPRTSNLG